MQYINLSSATRLLYWKKIIMTAETSGMKRTEWMRSHGIDDKRYYYWHRKLTELRMLDGNWEGLEDISIPDGQDDRNGDQSQNQDFVEYPVPASTTNHAGTFHAGQCSGQPGPQIMIQHGEYNIYVKEGFDDHTLSRVLGVIRHAQ